MRSGKICGRRRLCGLLAAACLLGLLTGGCARGEPETLPPETQAESALPETVVVPDGDPDSILCRESYTASPDEIRAAAGNTAAVMGDAELTVGQLQIRYCLAVSAYRQAGKEPAPDYDSPLDAQRCPLAEGLSWQHYFLREALEQWQLQQGLLLRSAEPQNVSAEYYAPDEQLHKEQIPEGLPARKYLYESKECYTPNSLHQAWLDGLPQTLEALAKEKGYDSLAALTAAFAGEGAGEEDFLTVAGEINRSYMYFTECSYEIAGDGQTPFGQTGVSGKTVDIRHCLLIPEMDNVDAGDPDEVEKSWDKCRAKAESLLSGWKSSYLTTYSREGNFARVANENSQDENSRPSGGLYTNLHRGQLIEPLDAWCFDEARQPGDTAVLRSEMGYHILYFRSGTEGGEREAGQTRFLESARELLESFRESNPVSVDYGAVLLDLPENGVPVCAEAFLYPDVAHERFPEPIIFLQRDFADAPYGPKKLGKVGCGITTMAMLVSYMTDEIHTPAQMAAKHTRYGQTGGTDGTIFYDVPPEYGFFIDQRINDWDVMVEALKEGRVSVSLQNIGYFTKAGHYMLLCRLNEDGTVAIRDSNILNYGRIENYMKDGCTKQQIMGANNLFYIFQKKITAYPDCCRCGGGDPSGVLTEDYLCGKCTAALARRNGFLSLCAGM